MICWARVHLVNFAFFLIKTITAMKKSLLGLSLMHLKIKHKNMQMRRFQLLLSIVLLLVAVPCFGQSIKINDIKYKVISDTEASLVDGFRAKGDVVIPEYVTIKGRRYKITSIGDYAFKKKKDGKYEKKNRCTINSIVMPNSITSIGNSAFAYCDLLSSINLSDSLIFIGNDAFEFCEDLKNITLPNSVIDIGRGAFSFSGIESIIIPDGVTCLNHQLFSYSSLESIILPNSITKIDSYIFSNCKRLRNVTLPNSITEIGYSIFERCENLKTIVVPDTTTIKRHRLMDKNPWGLANVPTIVGHNGKCPDWVVDDVLSNPEYYNGDWQNWAKEQVKSNALAEQASGVENNSSDEILGEETSASIVAEEVVEEVYSDDFVATWEKTKHYTSSEFPMSSSVKTVYINNYETDYQFVDGMLAIQNSETGKWGFIDEDGNLLKGGYKWSYLNYETPRFGAGHCLVALRDEESPYSWHWFILDKKGNAKPFDAGGDIYTAYGFNADGIMSVVVQSGYRGYVTYFDTDGNEVFENISSSTNLGVSIHPLGVFKDNRALFYNSYKKVYGYIDHNGNVIGGGKTFLDAQDFSDGLAAVLVETELGRRWGYIDVNGNMVIPAKFSKEPSPFIEGYAVAEKQNRKDVFINKKGEVCSNEYSNLTHFVNGYALASISTKCYIIDTDMNVRETTGIDHYTISDIRQNLPLKTVFDGKYIIYSGSSLDSSPGLIYPQSGTLYSLGFGPFSENRVHVRVDRGVRMDDDHYFLDRSGQVVIKFAKEEF